MLINPRTNINRRAFLGACGLGFGSLALSQLLAKDGGGIGHLAATGRSDPLAPRPPHFAAKATSIIYLNMTGGPSQLDLFDYKPVLEKLNGTPIPESALKGQRFTSMTNTKGNLLSSPWKFHRAGKRGTWISELLPHLSGVADELAIIRSMRTDEVNHVPAQLLFMSGSPRMGRPAMGSWATYGLGSACDNLPGYVVMVSGIGDRCGTGCWSSGFLPSVYQGVQLRSTGDPVLYLSNPNGMPPELRRASLDCLRGLNESTLAATGDPEVATRISAYEMAFRMQTSVPDLMDLAKEPAAIHQLYGTEPGKSSFANNCLLARRLVERGVRFVQLNHTPWDHHGGSPGENLPGDLPKISADIDRSSAALITDLKQRGLLDSTLIVWGGEFGRGPILQGKSANAGARFGRDHQGSAYTMWLAGGGITPGIDIGTTDDLGMRSIEEPVHVHDLQASIMHQLGLDHTKLTFRFQGRDYRLTDVHGEVVKKLVG